jgi:hypothetical protein
VTVQQRITAIAITPFVMLAMLMALVIAVLAGLIGLASAAFQMPTDAWAIATQLTSRNRKSTSIQK